MSEPLGAGWGSQERSLTNLYLLQGYQEHLHSFKNCLAISFTKEKKNA